MSEWSERMARAAGSGKRVDRMSARRQHAKVTRDDIERSLRAIQTGVGDKVVSQRTKIVRAASVAAWSVVLVVFLLGRRSGRKHSAIVEIRRV